MRLKDRFVIHTSKYFYLTCLLLSYFILTSTINTEDSAIVPMSMIFSAMILLPMITLLDKNIISRLIIGLTIVMVVSHMLITYLPNDTALYILFYSTDILFLSLGSVTILHSISQNKDITADTLFGAVCGYLFIGLSWSFIFLLINVINPDAFTTALTSTSLHSSTLNATYYSFTTLTTLGYGDILPVSYLARTFSWLEAVVGQIYLAVWISQLVGLRIAQNKR